MTLSAGILNTTISGSLTAMTNIRLSATDPNEIKVKQNLTEISIENLALGHKDFTNYYSEIV